MKALISKLKNFITHPFIQSSINPPATKFLPSAWLRGRDDTSTALAMLGSAYQQSTWVYACISTLAESVSAIPFRILHSPSSRASHSSHLASDLCSLLDFPHPEIDRFQFWELIVSWLMLRGEAFILPLSDLDTVASPRAPIKHLLVLNPDSFQEIITHNQLAGWRYTASGSNGPLPSQVLLPEEVVRIKLPNPFNFWRGLSPITVAWLAAQTDYAASQFMKGVMLNNADTGLVVSTTNQLTPEQIAEISAALRERKRSAGSADRPLFLWGGTHVEKPTVSTTDLQFLENRKFNRQELCAIFKVPQELLGYTEDANRSVADAMRLNFMEYRIAPLCKRLEAGIAPIINRFGSSSSSIKAEFHLAATPIMQAAQRARVRTATELFNLGVPMDVVSESLDLALPPLPHGRDSYLPTRVQKVGTLPTPLQPAELSRSHDPFARIFRALSMWQQQVEVERTLPGEPHSVLTIDDLRRLLPQLCEIADNIKRKDSNP